MQRTLSLLLFTSFLVYFSTCFAQQSEVFGKYEIHYNAINANLLPAQVVQGYGIKRSSSRAVVNITVLDKSSTEYGTPVHAAVTANSLNLTGQRRTIEMREIEEGDGAVYYIGELPIANMETYNFTVSVQLEGEAKPFELSFRQQFFTE
jgi:Domain of unknown function (DUF4426)